MSRIDEIRERAAKPTLGPWKAKPHQHLAKGCMCLSCDVCIGWQVDPYVASGTDSICSELAPGENTIDRCEETVFDYETANFMACSRDDVEYLLSECDAKDTTIAELRARLEIFTELLDIEHNAQGR